MTLDATFERRIDALPAIFDFTADFWAQHGPAAELHVPVDFVIEELFTNIVKYGAGQAPVKIALSTIPGGVQVVLEEPEACRFDPTQAPDADITLPIEQRTPGGLGLHLIKRMVDSIDYRYFDADRMGRVTFCKTRPPAPSRPGGAHEGETDVGDRVG